MATGKYYTIDCADKPTFFNKEGLAGASLLAFPALSIGTMGIGLGIAAAGLVGGSLIGYLRDQSNREHGRHIKPPSFLNSSLIYGALAGVAIVAGIALLTTVPFIAAAVPTIAGLSAGTGIVIAAGAAILSAFFGAKVTEKHRAVEYARAQGKDADLATVEGRALELMRLQGQDNPKVIETAQKENDRDTELWAKKAEKMREAMGASAERGA